MGKDIDEKIDDMIFNLALPLIILNFFICERDIKITALLVLQGCSKN